MKKIFLIFLIYFSYISFSFANTTLSYSPSSFPSYTEGCLSDIITGDIIKYGVPNSTGLVRPNGSVTCNTYFYYSYEDYVKNYSKSGVTTCDDPKDRVIGWTTGENGTITCRKGYSIQQTINTVSSDMTNSGGTNSRLKVSGLVGTNSNGLGITDNQKGTIKILNGDFDKSKLKSIIISETTKLINSVSQNNTDGSLPNRITNFPDLDSINNYGGLTISSNKNIKLFKTNKVVTIGDETYSSTPISISGKKTIVIYGGDLYINRDMYYTNNSILGIIVLKDKNGKGGNVLINPKVTNVVGTIFAQNSVLSAEVTSFTSDPQSITYYDGTKSNEYLRNQLYIYGSLFSENTIGGSKLPYKCPYYVTTCNQRAAIQYDLNYLRNYFLYKENKASTEVGDNNYVIIPYNNGKKVGGIKCNDSGICDSGILDLSKLNSGDDGFSVVIKYNSTLQTNPPPLFSQN